MLDSIYTILGSKSVYNVYFNFVMSHVLSNMYNLYILYN